MSNKYLSKSNVIFGQTIRPVYAGIEPIKSVTEHDLAIQTNFLIQIFYFTQLTEVYL